MTRRTRDEDVHKCLDLAARELDWTEAILLLSDPEGNITWIVNGIPETKLGNVPHKLAKQLTVPETFSFLDWILSCHNDCFCF
ncbi:hypothetical protein scyTo_0013232 [Scyliorhinus torazame]|uniref:Uncharacterized protein n=1 Tax=Scyliorhinus torazame TaxID=75743 RepID=A0A401NS37_SCYTO|nr:hypothetical protein [Scyliorhinus torazame]